MPLNKETKPNQLSLLFGGKVFDPDCRCSSKKAVELRTCVWCGDFLDKKNKRCLRKTAKCILTGNFPVDVARKCGSYKHFS